MPLESDCRERGRASLSHQLFPPGHALYPGPITVLGTPSCGIYEACLPDKTTQHALGCQAHLHHTSSLVTPDLHATPFGLEGMEAAKQTSGQSWEQMVYLPDNAQRRTQS